MTSAVDEGLGYEPHVNLVVEGGYETGSDRLTVRSFAIDAADIGKFSLSGIISGVKASDMTGDANPDALANGKLESLTIRFDDAGVVERALDQQAKMMGASREDIVAQLNGALPFMLTRSSTRPRRGRQGRPGVPVRSQVSDDHPNPAQPVPSRRSR
jgi:hypothetical protein